MKKNKNKQKNGGRGRSNERDDSVFLAQELLWFIYYIINFLILTLFQNHISLLLINYFSFV